MAAGQTYTYCDEHGCRDVTAVITEYLWMRRNNHPAHGTYIYGAAVALGTTAWELRRIAGLIPDDEVKRMRGQGAS